MIQPSDYLSNNNNNKLLIRYAGHFVLGTLDNLYKQVTTYFSKEKRSLCLFCFCLPENIASLIAGHDFRGRSPSSEKLY